MIDRLVICLPFADEFVVANDDFSEGILDPKILLDTELTVAGRNIVKDQFGKIGVDELFHPYERIPSWASGMAVKVFHRPTKTFPYVEIKASPAKLLQGHNVYGTTNFELCLLEMLSLLAISLPKLWNMLDQEHSFISSLDVTYSIKADTQQIADQFIAFASSLSGGQTKSGEVYPTTAYFGKKTSKHKRLKIYLKYYEVLENLKKLKKENANNRNDEAIKINSDQDLINYCKGLIRCEATIKKRFLMNRGIPTNIVKLKKYIEKYNQEHDISFIQALHEQAFKDIYKLFKGGKLMNYDDESILKQLKNTHIKINKRGKADHSLALRAFRFYRSIAAESFKEVKETTPASTFYRNLSLLKDANIPLAHLQNLHKVKSNVVPLIQLVKMDYSDQAPSNYKEPELSVSKVSQLRAVC